MCKVWWAGIKGGRKEIRFFDSQDAYRIVSVVLNCSMALVGDLLTPFSKVRVALSSIRNVSQRVIKGVDVLVKKFAKFIYTHRTELT